MPEIVQYYWQNGETSLPAFSRVCPSGLNGLNDPNMEGSGGSGVGVVHCQMGHVLAWTAYPCHARSYYGLNSPLQLPSCSEFLDEHP